MSLALIGAYFIGRKHSTAGLPCCKRETTVDLYSKQGRLLAACTHCGAAHQASWLSL